MKPLALLVVFLTIGSWLHFQTPASVHAASITVTTTTDELNTDGDCSLREAIQAANTNAAVDTCAAGSNAFTDIVTLSNGAFYGITRSGIDDTNANGDFDIADNVATLDIIFVVASAGSATINANEHDRIFHILTSASVSITGLTLRDGNASDGGGILVASGTLTLTSVTVTSNIASNNGGAISSGGALTINNSTLINNSAGAAGGGLYTSTSAARSIQNTLIGGNVASEGGGIHIGGTPTLTIQNTSMISNTADTGAAISGLANASFNLQNSTISGNNGNVAGTIYMRLSATPSSITSSTIASNISFGASLTGSGNIYTVTSSIIRGSCSGTLNDGGNNIAYPNACGAIPAGSDPLLVPLANNGGPTQTHMLTAGSPALNAYSSGCPATDQRGISRPQGTSCDIGAVEATSGEVPTPIPSATHTPTDTPSATQCVISVTAPDLLQPSHRLHTTDTTPQFVWSSVIGAQSYRLMVYLEDRSFEYKKRVFVSSYTLTSVEALVHGTKYLWRVRTQDTTCSTWSTWSGRNTLFID